MKPRRDKLTLKSLEYSPEPPEFLHLRTAPSSQIEMTSTVITNTNSALILGEGNDIDIDELLHNLTQSQNLQEQADIIHYFYTHKSVWYHLV